MHVSLTCCDRKSNIYKIEDNEKMNKFKCIITKDFIGSFSIRNKLGVK